MSVLIKVTIIKDGKHGGKVIMGMSEGPEFTTQYDHVEIVEKSETISRIRLTALTQVEGKRIEGRSRIQIRLWDGLSNTQYDDLKID